MTKERNLRGSLQDGFSLAVFKTAKDNYDIIIIEGLLALWDNEICNLCNLRVFVDCPADIRIVRRIKRNLAWGLSLEDITNVYLDLVRYRHEEFVEPSKSKADIVVDSSHGIGHGVLRVCEYAL